MAVAVEFISQKTYVFNSDSRCQHYVPEHRPKSPVTASAQSRGMDSLAYLLGAGCGSSADGLNRKCGIEGCVPIK